MDMRITGNNLSVSDALRSYMERSLRAGLAGVSRHLEQIDVRLSDVNGPRGGIDKLCGIRVVLRRAGVVFVHASDGDAYSTVDKAAARLKSAIGRRLGRQRSKRRRPDCAAVDAFA
jgi:putative sigma-54 modulation protein